MNDEHLMEREALAAVQHGIWAHWMRYLFSRCEIDEQGNAVIPADLVQRWQRQAMTDYADLTESEKKSDRDQADKVLRVLRQDVPALLDEIERLRAVQRKEVQR